MIDATIDVVGEKGYAELTVSDVIKRAGVSRRAFYEHFSNREECFFATYDSIMGESSAAVASAFGSGTNGLPGSAQGAIEAIFRARAAATGRGAGPARRDRGGGARGDHATRASWARHTKTLLRERLGLPPGQGPIANPVLRGVIGGIGAVLYSHVQNGKRKQLLELVPQLVQWTTSYWPAPPELMNLNDAGPDRRSRATASVDEPRERSRWARRSSKRRRLVGGENSVSPIYVAHSQRQRILDAVANLTAAHGYAALTVEGIAAEAAISLQAFYEHFPSKEDAFLVAYEVGHDKGLALVERAFDSQADWRLGVRAGIEALFDYLASEPAFAHLALVDVQAASARVTERAARGVTSYARDARPGLQRVRAR